MSFDYLNIKPYINFYISFVSLVLLIGCQTAPRDNFPRIQQGMTKSEVIHYIGGPRISERWHGKDRWIYHFPLAATEGFEIKEVHFRQGRVIYIGEEIQPKITAAEQDRLNEIENRKETKRLQRIQFERRESLGAVGPDPSVDLGDDFREKVYGIPRPEHTESEKRAPVFEEI